MKLRTDVIETLRARVDAEPVPETTIAHDHLSQRFGDHTFYLGNGGAYVFEPLDANAEQPTQLRAVQIAHWADDDHTLLKPQDPEPTATIVSLEVH